MESIQLENRFSFSISDKAIVDSLASVDDHSVVYLDDVVGAVLLKSHEPSQVIASSENGQFGAVSVSSGSIIFLERSREENGDSKVVIVNQNDVNDRKSFNLDVCGSPTLRFSTTDINGKLFIALLSKGDISEPNATLSVLAEDQIVCESTVPGLENISLDVASTSFQWFNSMLFIQSASSFWLYRFEKQALNMITNSSCKELGGKGELKCHSWVQDETETIIISSDCGKLFAIRSGIQAHVENHQHEIQKLLGLRKGFIAACSNGTFLIYSMNENNSTFIYDRLVMLPGATPNSDITTTLSMSLVPNAKTVFVMTSHPNTISKFNVDLLENVSVERIACFHSGQVNSVDTCIQMPLMVSAGADKMICVWNLITGHQISCKVFPDVPLEVCLHPFGKQLLIAFADEVLCAHILVDELRTFWRMPNNCRMCKFSEGGHQFAIVHDNVIIIFDFLSGERLQDLKGHNSRVQSLVWTKGDSEMISSDEDKIIYRWDVSAGCRVQECTRYKSYPYIKYVVPSLETMWLFAPGRSVDSLSTTSLESNQLVEGIAHEMQKGSLLLLSNERPHFCVFTSHPKNAIKIFNVDGQDHVEILVKERITSMSLSFDDKILITGFLNGSIAIYNLRDYRGSSTLLTEGPPIVTQKAISCSNNLLVSDIFVQERESAIVNLDNAVREVIDEFENRFVIKKFSNEEEIGRIEEKLSETMNKGSLAIGRLQDEQSRIKRKHDVVARNQSSIFEAETNKIERDLKTQMQHLSESRKAMSESWSDRLMQCEQQKRDLVNNNKTIIASMKEKFNTRLIQHQSDIKTSEKELWKKKNEFKYSIAEIEEEVDIQIENAKKRHHERLSLAREKTLRVSSENGILNKRHTALQRTLEDQKETIKILLSREEDMREQMKQAEESKLMLRGNYDARMKTKIAKIAAMECLALQAQQLQKFQYILDEKVTDLNICLAQNSDSEMKKETEDGLIEHVRLCRENAELERLISFSQAKVKSLQGALVKQGKIRSSLVSKRKNLLKWLQDCLDNIQNPDALHILLQNSVVTLRPSLRCLEIDDDEERSEAEELKVTLRKAQADLELKQWKNEGDLSKLRSQNQRLLDSMAEKKEVLSRMRLQMATFQNKNKQSNHFFN